MPQDFAHKEFLPSVVVDKTEYQQKYLRRETDLKSVDMKQTAPARIAFQGKIVGNNICLNVVLNVMQGLAPRLQRTQWDAFQQKLRKFFFLLS